MGFVARAFTPPGSGAFVPPPTPAAPTAVAAPAAPVAPTAPAPPAAFGTQQAPIEAARQRSATTATTLGSAAVAGQTARKTATVLG